MDTILIEDLELQVRVGVSEAERTKPQRLLLTVRLGLDFSAAAAADDLERTVNYHAVVRRLLHWVEGKSWRLIETLSVEVAELILAEFGPETVQVLVKKFILPETRHVAVEVFRQRGQRLSN